VLILGLNYSFWGNIRSMAKIHFWGVRGTIPTTLGDSSKIGMNTACVSLEFDDIHIILDAGTGLYKCGQYILNHPKKVLFLMSHYHWDHIQGFPHFFPFYRPNFDISIGSSHPYKTDLILNDLFDGIKFPIKLNQLSSAPHVLNKKEYKSFQKKYKCSSIENHHPGKSFAYRFELEKRSFVYCSDHELMPFSTNKNQKHVAFCDNVDTLILDAHYHQQDHPERRGWGHSFLEDSLELALRSNVKSLYLFHHDPRKSDSLLENEIKNARNWISEHKGNFTVENAKEGMTFSL
jgi:phosphoribosyl 1,2-cyclic phosphodiesterase